MKKLKIIKNLEPLTDIDKVKNEINKTTEALEKSIKFGSPSFSNFKDNTSSIKKRRLVVG